MSETRKLQQIGGTSLYVSLPKHWTSQMQLKRGDKVVLTPQPDGSMYIYPTIRPEKPRQIILDIRDEETTQSIKRRIIAAYMDGFDVIQMKASKRLTDEQHDVIDEITTALFGLEVIEVKSNMVTMHCLLTPMLPIEKTLQRVHNIISSMFTETILALKNHDANLARGVSKRIQDVTKLSLVVHRALRSVVLFPGAINQTEVTLIDCVDYLRVLHRIVEIAGNVNKIAESAVALGEQALPQYILEPTCEACNFILNLYNQSVEALKHQDIQLADNILDSKLTFEKLWRLCIEADEKSEISSLVLSHASLVIDNLNETQEYTAEIAEITIERAEANMRRG